MKKLARNLAAIILALFAANAALALELSTIGVDLVSHHIGNDTLNNTNPGLYGRLDNDVAAGVYYNSYKKTSVWAGYQFDWKYGGVLVGAVTGYPCCAVMPVVLPSARLPLGFRLSVMPKVVKQQTSTALHLSWEHKL